MGLGGGSGKGTVYEHVTSIMPHSQIPTIKCPFNKRTAFLRGEQNDSLLHFSVSMTDIESSSPKSSDQPVKKRKITEDIKITTQTEQETNPVEEIDFYPWLGCYQTADKMVGYLSDLIETKICGPNKVTPQEEEAIALEKRLKSRKHASDGLISSDQIPEYLNVLAWTKYRLFERENAIMKHLQDDMIMYNVCFKTRYRLVQLMLQSCPLPTTDIPLFAQRIYSSESTSHFYDELSNFISTVFNEEAEHAMQASGKMSTGYHH